MAKKSKENKNHNLEIAEELNMEPKFKPSKTGSVSQNTVKPVKSKK